MMTATERGGLDDALAALAHELRTPLTAIRGFADLLASLDGSEDEGTRRDIARRLVNNTQQLESLVDDMLDAAEHAGCESFEPSTFSLLELAHEVVTDVAVALASHNFVVRGEPAYAVADSGIVTRILISLLTNAAHYSPDGTTIEVETSTWAARAILAVNDCGPGIPESERTVVFERFWRGDRARERVRGLGIGLSTARDLCVRSGGEIRVCGSSSGGARFEVSLPGTG